MRISTNQFHSQGYSSIQQHQADILKTQLELSTGKKINSPGDDPVGLSQVHALNRTMSTIDQFSKNGDYAKTQLTIEETAISDSVETLQRVRELSIQMSNDTYTADDRKQASAEVDQLINQMLSMMNYSNSEGEKIFAGSNVNVEQAFLEDPSNPGYYTYIGNPNAGADYEPLANYGSRFVQIGFDDDNYLSADDKGDASRVRITDNGSKVFATDGTSIPAGTDKNIVNVLVALRDDLAAGNSPADSTFIDDIDSSIDQLSLVRTEIGGRMNRIESQYDAGEVFKASLEERRMTLEDTDIVQSITDLTKSQNALEMAQQVFTRVNGISLFDYLR